MRTRAEIIQTKENRTDEAKSVLQQIAHIENTSLEVLLDIRDLLVKLNRKKP
jgi:hypothetical protein